jgi:hypothetical protein
MRVWKFFIALVLCSAAWCSATIARAADRDRAVTFHAFGSYQTYDMADVNEAMRAALEAFPGAKPDKEKIDSGGGFGGGLRIWTSDRVFVPLEFQRLLASNSGSGPYLGQTYTIDLDVPAVAITTGIGYVFFNHRRARLALSGGAGYYVCNGEIVTRGPGLNDHSNLEGSGFGFHGIGHVFARIVRRVDLELAGGYRYAKTTDITSGGQRIRNSDGSLAQIDWSGVTGRAGISVRVSGE